VKLMQVSEKGVSYKTKFVIFLWFFFMF